MLGKIISGDSGTDPWQSSRQINRDRNMIVRIVIWVHITDVSDLDINIEWHFSGVPIGKVWRAMGEIGHLLYV